MWITFLDLLQKHFFFSESHDNFVVTAWELKIWDLTLIFVFSFLRKHRQVTYPLSPFLIFNVNLLTPPINVAMSYALFQRNSFDIGVVQGKKKNVQHERSLVVMTLLLWKAMGPNEQHKLPGPGVNKGNASA